MMYGSHEVTRIRREPRRRTLTVAGSERLTPHLLRVNFTGDDMADFDSASPGDHVKLFVPDAAGAMAMRDYTPRRFDAAAGTITIDFAIHEAGPATAWALAARPGDTIAIGGPKGSTIVPDDYAWYLLIGDSTAIPSISRRLEELRGEAQVITLIAVDERADCTALPVHPRATNLWHVRADAGHGDDDEAGALTRMLAALSLPDGDGYVWIAAEAKVSRALRAYALDTMRHPRAWLAASGYWARGNPGEHVKFGD